MAQLPEIPEAVWRGRLPYSVELAGVQPGLELVLGSGLRGKERTAVAAVSFRMPDPVVRRYRGRVDPAIQLVAVDLASGDVYAGPCMGHDRPPATFDATAAPQVEPGGPLIGGYVNVDIVAQLGLPPHAARYLVFAWLDEWVSRPRVMEVPADARREVSALRPPMNAGEAVSLNPAPAAGPGGPELASLGSGKVEARWQMAEPGVVVLVGYGLEDRLPRWELLAHPRHPLARAGSATVDAVRSAATPGPRAFVVVAGTSLKALLDRP